MSKVKLYTVQEKRNVRSILDGVYQPLLNKSYYYTNDDSFHRCYDGMLDALSLKTGEDRREKGETCLWAWYRNPFWRNHVNTFNVGKDLSLITFIADDRDIVASDFDMWCDKIEGYEDGDCIVPLEDKGDNRCIQTVLWSINPENILSVEKFPCM